MKQRAVPDRVVIGVIVVLLGVLLLLNTTGAVTIGVARWIPSAFILWAVWRMAASGFRDIVGPLWMIAIAGFVQLLVLGEPLGKWWPALLIFVGILVLIGGSHLRGRAREQAGHDDIDVVAVMGGAERRVTSRGYKGGQVTAVMGGVDLDLRGAEVAERPATLEVTAVMGGVEIKVPPDWVVRTDAFVLFGGTEDKRHRVETASGDGAPHLVVTGTVVFGGIEIKG
ncbi:MAG: hypothetical protein HYY01_15210 [Chloroflexi bacterium]|nr:hypothetical protein [Chloroflexota bacterium]